MTSALQWFKGVGEFSKDRPIGLWLTLVAALAGLTTGCHSTRVDGPPASVSVEFHGNTPGQIFAAAQEVFIAEGYTTKSTSPLRMNCDKPASKMSNLAYGDWLSGKLYIRVKLVLVEKGEAHYRLYSQAFKVTDREGLLEEEKLNHSGHGSYKKLLEKVAARLQANGG